MLDGNTVTKGSIMSIAKRGSVTLADVAEEAKVSRSTASRALNDSPRISEETKRHVREAARRIGFVPNAQGRALAVGRTETIAVIVTEPIDELFADPTYSAFLGGITERLTESAYLPVLLQASRPSERERFRHHLERRAFDAVIDISPYKGSEVLDSMRDLNIPGVIVGQMDDQPYEGIFSIVFSDDFEGAQLAAQAVAERGRTRPIAILGPADNPASTDRLAGYRQVFGEALGDERVRFTQWDSSAGFASMMEMLNLTDDFDAVLAGSDRIAVGVMEALRQSGIEVPEQVSVIGFDDHPLSKDTTPPLTTIHQPLYEEGQIAADLAMRMIDGERPSTVVEHMRLVERESL
ncbi:transcriptional regulator [Bifidobacterium lemurum]|uniref:Transcriptional regulator n=2 Tax=Bifidobacterium lemurum TaxID=1603886 RepID=A0A261FXE9_9BIFI|nr:transcriptional regulator [Bifidobacterium lemurum]